MLIAEAHIETEGASGYLVQFCGHVSKVARAQPQMGAHVEWSDDRGMISFDWGRCMLHALPDALTLRAEAPDEDTLQQVEHRVADLLERFGRREDLTVAWTQPEGEREPPPRPPTNHPGGGTAHD